MKANREWSSLKTALTAPVQAAFNQPVEIRLLSKPMDIPDATVKFLVKDREGRRLAVALCGAPASANTVRQGAERAKRAKIALGPELGSVILDPLGEGVVADHSYVILPYCRSIRNWGPRGLLDRFLVRNRIFSWLAKVAAHTREDTPDDGIEQSFAEPLRYLMQDNNHPHRLREAAKESLVRLESGRWKPVHVLTHFDFWSGNIVWAPESRLDSIRGSRFVVIDWPGSEIKGYSAFDLVRMANSLRLSRRRFYREMLAHAEILGCEPNDLKSSVLSAMGHIARAHTHMPDRLFHAMAMRCLKRLES